jgi:hypothetical protein
MEFDSVRQGVTLAKIIAKITKEPLAIHDGLNPEPTVLG